MGDKTRPLIGIERTANLYVVFWIMVVTVVVQIGRASCRERV